MVVSLRIVLAAAAVALAAAAPAQAAPAAPENPGFVDLVDDPGVFDPQFSWSAVSGARGYELEINSTDFWAPGSKVCCDNINYSTPMTTFGTSYSPPVVLANDDEYFWRVRAVDASNIAGPWRAGPSFQKSFGNTPSVPNLRLVDLDLATLAAGSTVDTPIVRWDAAPGASSYHVVVTPHSGGVCDWAAPLSVRWDKKTATTGWTPLGWGRGINADPLSRGFSPSDDLLTALSAGQAYCVRVSPIDRASSSSGPSIESDWTYLPANNTPAFVWAGPPAPGTCSPCAPEASDYLRPASNVVRMPVFTWDPVPGALSYFVVVASDPSFTTIEDYAYTRVTAYAPRTMSNTVGYQDKTSNYYWAVLPATAASGTGVSADPITSNPQPFTKQSTPPTLLGPAGGAVLSTAATVFHWTPAEAARRYRLQVSEDPTFANVIQEQSVLVSGAVTDSTAYTSSTSYPTGKTLYWRVQAEAENGGSSFVGLRWSTTGTFSRTSSGGTGTADKRFRVRSSGDLVRRRYRKVTITVRNAATIAPVARASVRASGAGVKRTTKKTGSLGKVTFRLRPKRLGTVTFRVAKTGFVTAYLKKSVLSG